MRGPELSWLLLPLMLCLAGCPKPPRPKLPDGPPPEYETPRSYDPPRNIDGPGGAQTSPAPDPGPAISPGGFEDDDDDDAPKGALPGGTVGTVAGETPVAKPKDAAPKSAAPDGKTPGSDTDGAPPAKTSDSQP